MFRPDAPLCDDTAERQVIGVLLLAPHHLPDVAATIELADFWRGSHRTIYEAIVDVEAAGIVPDTVTVADALARNGTLDSVGGHVYLSDLIADVGPTANVLHHAGKVHDLARRRRIIDAADALRRDVSDVAVPVDDAARGRLAELAGSLNGHHPDGGYRLWTLDDLAELAPPRWRILDVLPDEALTVLYGVQSTYKSFVALAWSLSIAAGVPWLGRGVEPGNVVYVAAEGGPGLLKRVRAWLATNPDADPATVAARFRALPHPVDLRSPVSVDKFRVALAEQLDVAPALIVVDTWSRSMPGANENSAEDTSAAIGKLDALRGEFGCGVTVVHHAGLEGGRERGSTSLPYAADCRWETDGKPNASTVVLRNHKQKDWADSDPIPLRRHVVGEGEGASLVLRLNAVDPCAEHHRVVSVLDQAGAVTQRKVESMLAGNAAAARELAKATAACPHCPVESWTGDRNARFYVRSDQNEVPL